jgi:hypothetical protein
MARGAVWGWEEGRRKGNKEGTEERGKGKRKTLVKMCKKLYVENSVHCFLWPSVPLGIREYLWEMQELHKLESVEWDDSMATWWCREGGNRAWVYSTASIKDNNTIRTAIL